MSDCVERVRKIFSEKLLLDVQSSDIDLLDSGILDSMAFVELLLNLENEFGFQVAMETVDLENFRSISRIAELVEGARTAQG